MRTTVLRVQPTAVVTSGQTHVVGEVREVCVSDVRTCFPSVVQRGAVQYFTSTHGTRVVVALFSVLGREVLLFGNGVPSSGPLPVSLLKRRDSNCREKVERCSTTPRPLDPSTPLGAGTLDLFTLLPSWYSE